MSAGAVKTVWSAGAVSATVGLRFVMVAVVPAVAVPPLPSLTVTLTANVPRLAQACVGETPVPVAPSPKSQVYVRPSPSGSAEPAAVKVIAWLRTAVYGPPALAVGPWFVIVAEALAVAVPPLPSLTVTLTGNVPSVAYECVGDTPLPV